MEYQIKLPKRLYDDIVSYCDANHESIEKYCTSALIRQLSLDKYGDLNEKMRQKQNVDEAEIEKKKGKIEENVKVEEKTDVIAEELKEDVMLDEKKEERKHRRIQTK